MEAQRKYFFSLKNAFWSNKSKGKSFFTKTYLKRTVQFLVEKSYFTVGNVLLLQTVGIRSGINPASFWANLFLRNYESKYITNLMRTNKLTGRRFHSTFRFIDDLRFFNECGEFGKVFLEICATELELKMEHNGSHQISLDQGKFIYKMLDKRYAFNFHIIRIPSITINIPPIIFYNSTAQKYVRITENLLDRMISQDGFTHMLLK